MAHTGYVFLEDHPDVEFEPPIVVAPSKEDAKQKVKARAEGPVTFDDTIEIPDEPPEYTP